MLKENIYLSIIIPVYNERENLEQLYNEIIESLGNFEKKYEIVFVDDGSEDGSFSLLKKIHKRDPRVKIIRLRRNFGQTAALSAGFDFAKGKVIITMDGDLQNDPHDIPKLIEKLEEGYDIVSGWRYKRRDNFFTRRLPSIIANWLISLITNVKLHDYGCTLKAFRGEVIKSIKLYGEMHRFIPAIASSIGVKITEIKVNHRKRRAGKSKYGISRTIRVFLDLITVKFLLSYSTRPLQVFGLIGLISGLTGTAIGVYLSYQRLILKTTGLTNRPLLLLAILLIFIGVQFITMGLLAEMISRTYHESVNKKIYTIREIIE
ncbi:glycosyltransferase family 2 protein [Candidatus Aminicenantes bacterium AC-708-M15]|jgi:glycosyltransferase involved in cell wall biosynthesis|nr:glycosyltransferase family 2 protein [SCandidatus Aminicenantes bacterium Aminicenantia_JdfR_composite]MCP2596374.1 glycosyltransferase family 2 protein [Candidatus Aminicenantes bacterium AC-335-G13]MCP2604097.1 glycosyltransferase family 2 protein [Candidatus Aminicenantes bacterium AC-708-M15]MCP2605386.1 glycosyltransferase family 2 protein [Candidatus Aminicenantes bacterium AC-335-O07]MCP2606003.1 glycosyltransferase family 2 protein [Candidatus Aminicenantes bacterium AC-708-I09]MCP2